VLSLLLSSCAPSTWKHYESTLKKYINFCKDRCYNAWEPNLNIILKFLTKLYEDGLSYSSINLARLALSTLLPPINGEPIGQQVLVTRILKGVGKVNPPLPKYLSTWDANALLNVFKEWPSKTHLSLEKLSIKLVSLLALVTAQRSQTLTAIQISNIKLRLVLQNS